jgi:tripartite-type tricarboxylate transporter receptor subunit TctC
LYARRFAHALAVAAIALDSFSAAAAVPQDYPSRPIRIIVPSAPGGLGDLLARRVGERLGSTLRTPVVVDNKPGGSGVIGNELAARAAPDGYTLLFATSATHIIGAHAIGKLTYDPLRVSAHHQPRVRDVGRRRELCASCPHARRAHLLRAGRRRQLLCVVGRRLGQSSTPKSSRRSPASSCCVPYPGPPTAIALLADEVQLMFGAITSALPYVQAGKLRALVVLVDTRSPLLPDVPTIAQAGLGSVDVRKWLGFVAPATPPEIVEHLNRTLDRILHEPEMRVWLDRQGLELVGGSGRISTSAACGLRQVGRDRAPAAYPARVRSRSCPTAGLRIE